jgi:hypothetical protein
VVRGGGGGFGVIRRSLLGWVLGLALVTDISDVTVVMISSVTDSLYAAVGKVDLESRMG